MPAKRNRLISVVIFSFFILITVFSFSFIASGSELEETIDDHGNLRLLNEYIAIVVNTEENARSRFAVETTGGDPGREEDEDMPLIYGRPIPWTSYTTFRIDGENYAFGGETDRRAGGEANYGEELREPEVQDGAIVSKYELNELEIEQNLEIVQSTTTGLYDTAKIEYSVTNTGDEPKEIGTRIMLDTMLGEVDGSPFRVEEESITTDTRMTQDELPNFYQSFDRLTDPQITSQGGFIGEDIDTPDRVYMSNWGSLADGPWDFNFEPGREFLREGEFETDSAIALYWDPETIEPGETVTYATSYGLGGITMVPGMLSLGISAPTEFSFSPTTPELPVVAYIENTTDITAENVTVSIDLPDYLEAEEPTREIGDLEAGEVAQINYYASALTEDLPGRTTFEISAEAENTDTNIADREIDLIAPAQLETDLSLVEDISFEDGKLRPLPFQMRLEIENVGEKPFEDFESELIVPPGIDLASYERAEKMSSRIEPGENISINWSLIPHDVEGTFPFAVQISGHGGFSETKRESIEIPPTSPSIYYEVKRSNSESRILTVDVKAANLDDSIESIEFKLGYNEEIVNHVFSSRGTYFVRDDRLMAWDGPKDITEEYISFEEQLPDGLNQGGLARMRFKIEADDSEELQNMEDLENLIDEFEILEASIFDEDGSEDDNLLIK